MMDMTPRYRIRTVSEMTQISEPTLRAWERRYGIPQPQRSDNRYRLYSDQDIQLIRYMNSLSLAGHSPSEAAQLAINMLQENREPEINHAYPTLSDLSQQMIEACIGFHGVKIEALLKQAMSMGSAWLIYQQVIEPALIKVGELWEQGLIGIEREQLFSQAVKNTLIQIINMMRPPIVKKKILFACIAEELHDIPLYGLAIYASHKGWTPIILGARLPAFALESACQGLQIDAIALSSTTQLQQVHPSFQALSFFGEYQKACGHIPWMIGGNQARRWGKEIEALGGKVAYNIEDFGKFLDLI